MKKIFVPVLLVALFRMQAAFADVDLSIVSISATPSDSNVVYHLTYRNAGPSGVSNAALTLNFLNSPFTFVSSTAIRCTPSRSQILCSLGPVASGATGSKDVTVTPTNAGNFVANAILLADPIGRGIGDPNYDPNTSNNARGVTIAFRNPNPPAGGSSGSVATPATPALPSCPDGEATYPSNADLKVRVEVAVGVTIPYWILNDQNAAVSETNSIPSMILRGHYGSDDLGGIADFVPSSDSTGHSPHLASYQSLGLQGYDNHRVQGIDAEFTFRSSACPDAALLRIRQIQSPYGPRWYATQSSQLPLVRSPTVILPERTCIYGITINATSLFSAIEVVPGRSELVPIEFCATDATHVWKNRVLLEFTPSNDPSSPPVRLIGGPRWHFWRSDTFSRPTDSSDIY